MLNFLHQTYQGQTKIRSKKEKIASFVCTKVETGSVALPFRQKTAVSSDTIGARASGTSQNSKKEVFYGTLKKMYMKTPSNLRAHIPISHVPKPEPYGLSNENGDLETETASPNFYAHWTPFHERSLTTDEGKLATAAIFIYILFVIYNSLMFIPDVDHEWSFGRSVGTNLLPVVLLLCGVSFAKIISAKKESGAKRLSAAVKDTI